MIHPHATQKARAALRRTGHALQAPGLALLLATGTSAVLLAAVDAAPVQVFLTMLEFGSRPDSLVSAVNRSVVYFLAGLAVAIGFRMNLFNIGVEGQYRLAALFAAAVGTALSLPPPLHLAMVVLVAMAVGAAWAGIAAVLKTHRGISEVLSTLLLNYVATAVVAFLLAHVFARGSTSGSTPELPSSARLPNLNGPLEAFGVWMPSGVSLGGAVVGAVAVGAAVHWLLKHTWYGFDLKATGMNPAAARNYGVDPRRMVLTTMLVSGALAGLAGLPHLLGSSYRYGLDFPSGAGFTGIAVALLGRNNPLGIAAAALLFGWLERSALVLDVEGVPKEIVTIMQGVIVISVVVAHEVVRRRSRMRSARLARAPLAPPSTATGIEKVVA